MCRALERIASGVDVFQGYFHPRADYEASKPVHEAFLFRVLPRRPIDQIPLRLADAQGTTQE